MDLSPDAVLALAPDAASAKAARGLTSPGSWPLRGHDERAVWGECQGSGAKPYQTQVDLNGPAFRCSCPSRKFPCKHGLALLLMRAQDAAAFTRGGAPAWVDEWLASRGERARKETPGRSQVSLTPSGGGLGLPSPGGAEKADEREQRAAERQAERDAERAADPVAAAAADARAVSAREAQRWKRIEAGLADLERWMGDAVQRGLANLPPDAAEQWSRFAARMVDAQAGGLAGVLRECAALIHAAADWPERLLARMGRLQLVAEAVCRREQLSADVRADLRATLGWPLERDEVLAQGERVPDRWTVLGQVSEEREHRLVERRVWLHGQASGRRALLLDFAAGGQGFASAWLTGSALQATLAFFPSRVPLRALVAERDDSQPVPAQLPEPDAPQEWRALAQRLAGHAWLPLAPLLLGRAVPRPAAAPAGGSAWQAVAEGRSVPLALADDDAWLLLAMAGGRPVTLAGEWDGQRLRPFTAWGGEGLWTAGAGGG
jgi:hypothetical protein